MDKFFTFVVNHWELWLALVVIFLLIIWAELRDKMTGVMAISPQDTTNLINHSDAKIVDIRETGNYHRGHIIGSIHIPKDELSDKLAKLPKDKEVPIVVVCVSGQTAVPAAAKIKDQGYSKVYTLKGGINAWKHDKMPLTKGK